MAGPWARAEPNQPKELRHVAHSNVSERSAVRPPGGRRAGRASRRSAQIWRWLRAVGPHNQYFGALDAAVTAATRFFAKLIEPPEVVLRLSGLAGTSLLWVLAGVT